MQLVINISDYDMEYINNAHDIPKDISLSIAEAIINGKVIPPHGRLIDADAFDERVRAAGGMSEEELTEDFKDGVQTVLYMLSKQPPVIEAEGGET